MVAIFQVVPLHITSRAQVIPIIHDEQLLSNWNLIQSYFKGQCPVSAATSCQIFRLTLAESCIYNYRDAMQ